SLTWTATTTLPTGYTFFVHLTAPDAFVKAQQDQPPFGNARPTTVWQPGELYADRFELTLDAGVGPGQHLLLAGLYDPVSGERVELREGPAGPAPGTVLLGKVAIE